MLQFILMGAQAAGSIMSSYAQRKSFQQSQLAAGLEQQQLQLRLQQEVVASNQQGLANLDMLEQTLASQRALSAARGAMPGVGSTLSLAQKSVRGYQRDEKARALSMDFLKTQRKYQMGMSSMRQTGQKFKYGVGMFKQGMSQLSTMGMQAGGGGIGGIGGMSGRQGLLTGEIGG